MLKSAIETKGHPELNESLFRFLSNFMNQNFVDTEEIAEANSIYIDLVNLILSSQ